MKNCKLCNSLFELKSHRHPNQEFCSRKCSKTNWVINNPNKNLESKRKYALDNKEKHVATSEKYRKNNMGYYREYMSLRTRKVTQAKPQWLNEFEELWLEEIYDLAIKTCKQVDHIIPITNKIVCGLHVPWNLQLLSSKENQQKHNKFSQDEDLVVVLTKE